MPNSPQENGTPDFERRFYTVLEEGLGSATLPSFDDWVNVADGPTAVVQADGGVTVLLKFTEDGVKQLMAACIHDADHDCPMAGEFARYMMYVVAGQLEV